MLIGIAAAPSGKDTGVPWTDFGRPCERDFVKVNLHVSIFEQDDKNDQQRAAGLCVGGRE